MFSCSFLRLYFVSVFLLAKLAGIGQSASKVNSIDGLLSKVLFLALFLILFRMTCVSTSRMETRRPLPMPRTMSVFLNLYISCLCSKRFEVWLRIHHCSFVDVHFNIRFCSRSLMAKIELPWYLTWYESTNKAKIQSKLVISCCFLSGSGVQQVRFQSDCWERRGWRSRFATSVDLSSIDLNLALHPVWQAFLIRTMLSMVHLSSLLMK
jgi:hypothetical protein